MPIYLYPVIFARCNDNRKAKKRAFVSCCVSDIPKGKKYKAYVSKPGLFVPRHNEVSSEKLLRFARRNLWHFRRGHSAVYGNASVFHKSFVP